MKKIVNLCDTCRYHIATCASRDTIFAKDRDPTLVGAAADAVVYCNIYANAVEKGNPSTVSEEVTVEFTGKDSDYYLVEVLEPKRLPAYTAECEDIIEALNMTFAEGNAFKAIWRSCAARTLGKQKKGQDTHGVYDAEKVEYYGSRMLAVRKRLAKT